MKYLVTHGAEFFGLVTSAGVGAGKELIVALPALQVVANCGVRFDKIDLAAARARSIAVSNTLNVLTDCFAAKGIGFMASFPLRYSVVDEGTLVNPPQNQVIAGAAMDVFASKPHVPAKLLTLYNALLLPYIASPTQETFAAMEKLVLDNLRSFFNHGYLLIPVE